jgi:hypothetical protein
MPLYHFHVRNSRVSDDSFDLPDDAAARTQAVTTAGQLLQDEPEALKPGAEWVIQVDDGERPVFTLRIGAE